MTVGVLPVSAGEALSFTFEGAGWGHGVGFSQWGARGQALEDPTKAGEDIAAYYYPGSEPGSLSDLELENDLLTTVETPIWVNLASEVTILEFTAVGGPLELCLDNDGAGPCPKPEQPQAGNTWEFRRIQIGECGFFQDDVQQGSSGDCQASITWPNADGVQLRDLTHSTKICAAGGSSPCEYRHGELKLRDDPTEVGFHVALAIGLDDLIKGIRELPDDWTSVGVNEAQAVAARSYGAYKFFANEDSSKRDPDDLNADPGITDSRKDTCWCHLYDDSTDMQYVAWDKETDAPHWVTAVVDTSDRVVTYLGASWESYTQEGIVQAFFSASSGGWTNTNILGFGTRWDGVDPNNSQWPYLVTVADPWATDPQWGNPNASWEESVDASTIASLINGVGRGHRCHPDRGSSRAHHPVRRRRRRLFDLDHGGRALDPDHTRFELLDGHRHRWPVARSASSAWTVRRHRGVRAYRGHLGHLRSRDHRGLHTDFVLSSCQRHERPDGLAHRQGDELARPGPAITSPTTTVPPTRRPSTSCTRRRSRSGARMENTVPNDYVPRRQMAAFLARSLNLTAVSGDYFTDDDGSQYEHYINAIAEAGVHIWM